MFCQFCGAKKNGYPFCGVCGRSGDPYAVAPSVFSRLSKKEFLATTNDRSVRNTLIGLRVAFSVATTLLSLLSLLIFAVMFYFYQVTSDLQSSVPYSSGWSSIILQAFNTYMDMIQMVLLIYLCCTLISLTLGILSMVTKSTTCAVLTTILFTLTQGFFVVCAMLGDASGSAMFIWVLGLFLCLAAFIWMIVCCSFLQADYLRSQP